MHSCVFRKSLVSLYPSHYPGNIFLTLIGVLLPRQEPCRGPCNRMAPGVTVWVNGERIANGSWFSAAMIDDNPPTSGSTNFISRGRSRNLSLRHWQNSFPNIQ